MAARHAARPPGHIAGPPRGRHVRRSDALEANLLLLLPLLRAAARPAAQAGTAEHGGLARGRGWGGGGSAGRLLHLHAGRLLRVCCRRGCRSCRRALLVEIVLQHLRRADESSSRSQCSVRQGSARGWRVPAGGVAPVPRRPPPRSPACKSPGTPPPPAPAPPHLRVARRQRLAALAPRNQARGHFVHLVVLLLSIQGPAEGGGGPGARRGQAGGRGDGITGAPGKAGQGGWRRRCRAAACRAAPEALGIGRILLHQRLGQACSARQLVDAFIQVHTPATGMPQSQPVRAPPNLPCPSCPGPAPHPAWSRGAAAPRTPRRCCCRLGRAPLSGTPAAAPASRRARRRRRPARQRRHQAAPAAPPSQAAGGPAAAIRSASVLELVTPPGRGQRSSSRVSGGSGAAAAAAAVAASQWQRRDTARPRLTRQAPERDQAKLPTPCKRRNAVPCTLQLACGR